MSEVDRTLSVNLAPAAGVPKHSQHFAI